MSIFASRTQQTVPIPFDEPHTVTIRKLAGRHLQAAREASQAAAVAAVARMGGAAFQRELQAAGGNDPAAVVALVAAQQADPLNGLDRYVVLAKGIVAWTYVDEAGAPLPVSAAAIDDLDEQAADFLARAIVALSPTADEASRKND